MTDYKLYYIKKKYSLHKKKYAQKSKMPDYSFGILFVRERGCDRSVVFSTNKTDRHDKTESGVKHHNPNP